MDCRKRESRARGVYPTQDIPSRSWEQQGRNKMEAADTRIMVKE